MRIGTAWLLVGLSSALCLPAGIAIAQDGTVVSKSPPATGTVAPQNEQDLRRSGARAGRDQPGRGDEGAGWDAAVEAAPAPRR